MTAKLLLAAALLAAPAIAQDAETPAAPSPGEIVAAAPASEWIGIAPDDLLVLDLAPDAKDKPRRVVIQLMPPPFSQPWVANIRTLAKAHWWDGLSIVRAQDNYVVQWGDPDAEDAAKARKLPRTLRPTSDRSFTVATGDDDELRRALEKEKAGKLSCQLAGICDMLSRSGDQYSDLTSFKVGFPIGATFKLERQLPLPSLRDIKEGKAIDPRLRPAPQEKFESMWPVHCYGTVGVGRDLPPDAGSGAELYTVIGHAPRHLDRNIAVVGRVIEGIEHLSTLPRGTGPLGFYETPEERVPIAAIRLGSEVANLPAFQYLSTDGESFARYADARANRRDPFFIVPAGGADVCNIPVPVRRAPVE